MRIYVFVQNEAGSSRKNYDPEIGAAKMPET